ncbi:MAG TPA: hemolysin family protein [Pyrinomonadaceae bacterium]|nr:hemolysin family protein [Pyrinomonadaceae bacterium]
MGLEIAVCVSILLVVVFLATVDMAFSHLSDLGLRRLATDIDESSRQSTYEFLREIADNRPLFRFAITTTIQLLLITFAVIVVVLISWYTLDRTSILIYSLLVGLLSTIVFRQLVPRLIVRNNPDEILLLVLPVVRPLYSLASIVASPFASLFRSKEHQQKLESTVTPDSPDEKKEDDDEDIQALLEVGQAEGILEEDEREMIESMVEFAETRIGEIMTPRTEICAIPADATVRAARDLIIDQKYSRIPVYRDSIDNIEGVIYVRDLLQFWADGGKEDQQIGETLRDPYFVPETKSAADLLKKMQVDHVQIAIVVDEYGGVAGVVTVEDLIEEIVGEIEDEDIEDEEIIEIIEGEDGYYDVLGSTEIDKIERLFGIDLEDGDYSTIAGMVTNVAGYVPKVGEVLSIRGLAIEVKSADEKRLMLLRIRPVDDVDPIADHGETTG